MGVGCVTIHRVAAAPGQHGLGHVGQTEGEAMQLLHPGHKAGVSWPGVVNMLGQANGAVIPRHVETLLTKAITACVVSTGSSFTMFVPK